MANLPLKKLRNFGGKLGGELEALGCATAGEVACHPRAALEARFGMQRAAWMLQAVNGISDEPVQVRRRLRCYPASGVTEASGIPLPDCKVVAPLALETCSRLSSSPLRACS